MSEAEKAEYGGPVRQDFAITMQDGIVIRGHDYGDRLSSNMPLVCLPGLTRSVRDFHEIAVKLSKSSKNPRRVITMDYRGRGRSDYDKTWENYNPLVESNDILATLTGLGLHKAAFLGTSRGGINTMLLGTMRPGLLAGAILHDIGPEIDLTGLVKIKGYVTRMPQPKNWLEAALIIKTIQKASFPNNTEEDWMEAAKQTFRDENGRPVIDYDSALMKTLASITVTSAAPNLTPQFLSLRNVPLLAIRGALSDILSAETFRTMDKLHPTMLGLTVPDQGHVPSLQTPQVFAAIESFLQGLDPKKPRRTRTKAASTTTS